MKQGFRQSMAWLHTWTGLLVGWVLLLIFMLAVLPQFVDPHAPLTAQYLIIGATMVSVDLIVMAGYTGLAARVLTLLRTPRQQRITNRVFASLFLAAAALLSTVRRAAV